MPQATAPPRNPLDQLIKLICSEIFRPCVMLPRRSTVNMNTAAFFETLLKLCQVTRRHVPYYSIFHIRRLQNYWSRFYGNFIHCVCVCVCAITP
jgi:hypothetical protein